MRQFGEIKLCEDGKPEKHNWRGKQHIDSKRVMWGGGDVNYMLMLIRVCLNHKDNEMSFTLGSQVKMKHMEKQTKEGNKQKHAATY